MKLLTPLALLFSFVVTLQAEPEYPKMGADIYDTQVDGVTQIKQALAKAKAGHKHVLLDLGANWCIWCRRLTHTFETDASVTKTLDENFVLVLIDVNHRGGKHRNDLVNARYDNPTKEGLPVLVVLDADGVHLTTQETGALEDGQDAHDPAKVLAFLQQWAPKR